MFPTTVHNRLLITNRSWILTIHKSLLENKEMVFKNEVINIEAAAYNGARTVVYWTNTDIIWNLNKTYQVKFIVMKLICTFFWESISLKTVVLPTLQFKIARNLDQISTLIAPGLIKNKKIWKSMISTNCSTLWDLDLD